MLSTHTNSLVTPSVYLRVRGFVNEHHLESGRTAALARNGVELLQSGDPGIRGLRGIRGARSKNALNTPRSDPENFPPKRPPKPEFTLDHQHHP